ncbi:ubiquinone biosynthesis O-methyltransferase [Hortaea werneckii]|uniref:Ubiquinone biosynthesis O-methyltransferase, mitochondrial n=1 Tax=Hortaea werneckii TaxID=91943 RepID=A0A3M7D9P7_HORWE|nr:ubiquinone biosynthesis O-methyltransferase [Hortaea werneckii]KAI7721933.1 ubiquinone biosynthesis O-methyltransferase [Hortaea werneckii]RMY61041.1 hypothetical protein D0865_01204 [Hortaea werneckii]
MASTTPSRLLQLPAAVRRAAFSQCLTPAPALFSTRTIPTPHQTTAATFPPHQRHYATTTESSTSSDSSASSSSVNATEVSHFNALASSWWDPHGSSRLLHLMNPLRHDFINRCLTQQQGGSSISEHDSAQKKPRRRYLDVGCGGGIFAESAARKSIDCEPEVIGVDPTPEVIAVARRHAREDPSVLSELKEGGKRLQYINSAVENLGDHVQFPDQTSTPGSAGTPSRPQFDIVTLFEVIEHIQHPSPFLSTCLSHVKPGGWLIGSTIARHPVSWFTTKFMAEDILRMVPRGTHDWNQYIQPWELKEWVGRQPELSMGDWQVQGVVYVPGVGWKEVDGSEGVGNYFFGMRKRE